MTIDLDDIESRINDGIYGDDRMTDTARDDAFSALAKIIAEVDRLRALESDAERALVKAELWNYYEAFVAANGAGSITELIVQRDEARAEMDAVHSYLSLSGVDATDHYRHVGVRDSLLPRVRQVVSDRDALRADVEAAAGELRVPLPTPGTTEARLLLANVAMRRERDEARAGLANIEQIVRAGMVVARAAGRDEERAAVVAWLRDEEYHILALAIERGEHRREEE